MYLARGRGIDLAVASQNFRDLQQGIFVKIKWKSPCFFQEKSHSVAPVFRKFCFLILYVVSSVLITKQHRKVCSAKSCISEYQKKGILNKREYLGPVWLADVWPVDDIPFCSIFTYFQYSSIHDLALNIHTYIGKSWQDKENVQFLINPSNANKNIVIIDCSSRKITTILGTKILLTSIAF